MSVRWTQGPAGLDGPHPFGDEAWMRAWWDAFGTGAPQVAVLERDGTLAAALPLMSRHGRLRSQANYHSPVFEPAAADEAAAEEALRAAFARREPEVFLHAVPERALPLVRRAAAGRRVLVEPAHVSPIVATEGDFDAYVKGLHNDIRRRRRKLEREHELAFELHDGGDDLDGALERGFAIEGSGWKEQAGTAILSSPQTRAFYTSLARAYRDRGELLLGELLVDGRAVAWHFNLRRGRRLFMLKTGYDAAYRTLGPGIVLSLMTIERCFEDPGLEAYELLGEAEPWKLRFANGERRHVRVAAYTRGPVGTAGALARRHGLPLARRARDRAHELREGRS